MDELDKLLSDDQGAEPTPSSEPKAQEETTEKEVQSKQEQLANINRAIAEANSKLKTLRNARKQSKEEDEEEIPKIDFSDPSSKAWNRHIQENVSPLQAELEKEREEVRSFALKEFLIDKPDLAKNQEKLREVMEVYERAHTASERTTQGVINDLEGAYAYVFRNELINRARQEKIDQATTDMIFSDPAVSRGATAYEAPKQQKRRFSQEELEILAKWNYSPAEAAEDFAKYGK